MFYQKVTGLLYRTREPSLFLFLDYDSQIILKDRGEGLLNILEGYKERGVQFNKIVIQLSDEFPQEEIDAVRVLFNYLKSLGIPWRLDHIGLKNGNLERLAYLMPNIVKIDLSFLNR